MSWRHIFRRNKLDGEWREEMEANIDLATDAFLTQGMTPEQARAAALKQAGNMIARREEIYQMNGIGWLDRFGAICATRCAACGTSRHLLLPPC